MIFKSSGYFSNTFFGHGIVARNCVHFDHSLFMANRNCFRCSTVISDHSNSLPFALPTNITVRPTTNARGS